jgi:HK97 family phage portal protein
MRDFVGGTKTVATVVPTWVEGKPVDKETNFEQIVKEGWRKNELIFACINKTANTASQVNLQIMEGDEKKNDEHPLKLLIDRPNPFMSQFDLWYSVLAFQKLAGWAVFEKERSASGQPVALWPLRPDWVKEIPSSKTVIGAYEYGPPGIKPARIKPEDVLAFRVFDPLGIYHHWPPVAVAARIGTVDNSTTDYLTQFFDQGGVPPGILKTRMKINDAIVADLRRRWTERYGGFQNWMAPAVLDSDAEYQKVGLDFREMGFENLDARNEARICMVLDVPPIMVSANIGLLRSTFSNYREARLAWWQDSLLPVYSNLEDALINGFEDDFGMLKAQWDFSRVPALQEERSARWERAIKAFTAGAITLNQFAGEVGFPNYGSWGDHLVRQLSYVEIRPGMPMPESNPAIEPSDEPVSTDGDTDSESREEDTPETGALMPQVKVVSPRAKLDDLETNMEEDLTDFLKGQRKRVIEQVEDEYGGTVSR